MRVRVLRFAVKLCVGLGVLLGLRWAVSRVQNWYRMRKFLEYTSRNRGM